MEGAPGGGRRGRLATRPALSPDQREDLEGQVAAELRRRYRSLDQATGYIRVSACRRQTFLSHFDDPAEPAPEERCCDVCSPPPDLVALSAIPQDAPRARAAAAPAEALSVDERRTFDALRAWRGEVAKELGWPAFRVASNRTLSAIAQAAPRDERTLAAVRGVGPWLMETHAPRILDIVASADG